MRFFIALEIPEKSQQQLSQVQTLLKSIIPEVRPSNQDKLHLTLAFVGEQPDQLKDKLVEILAQAAAGIPPFEVTPAYIDGFPNLHHAHTMWVGVKGDIDKLMLIRERVKDGLENLHLPVDERRYQPHIAIGKLTDFQLQPDQEAKLQSLMQQPFDPIEITSIKLFESIPEGSLHRHNTLAEVKLIKTP